MAALEEILVRLWTGGVGLSAPIWLKRRAFRVVNQQVSLLEES